jgi:hypothetical protein
MTTRTSDYVPVTPITREVVDVRPAEVTTHYHRFSWTAIVAGVIISLVTMFALNMLGLAIGAATVNPAVEAEPVAGLGTGAMIWLAASNLISLFLGGVVAGRMSGLRNDTDGAIHGLATFGAVILLGLTVATTSVGGIANSVLNAAGQAVGGATQAAAQVAPEVAEALNVQTTTLDSIQSDVSTMFRQATATTTTADDAVTQEIASARTVPSLDELELNRSVATYLMNGAPTAEDRTALVTMLTERTGISQTDADAMVTRWETSFAEVRANAEEVARNAAQAAADTVTALAGAVFAAMVIGAFAAGIGGMVGTPGGKI